MRGAHVCGHGVEVDGVARAGELPHIGERDGAARQAHGQQPLIEAVLQLGQRQLVGVVVEGVLDVPRDLKNSLLVAEK